MSSPSRIASQLRIAALLAVLVPGGGIGSAKSDPSPAPPTHATLEELMHGMATTIGVVAEFHEVKHLALLSEPLHVRGTLYFVPPGRLVRITDAPSPSRLWIDGERLAFRNEAGGDQVDLSDNPIARAFVTNFIVLFNGDLAALRERYEPRFETEGASWTLVLRPRARPLSDVIERVTLAGEGRALTRMELREIGGDRTITSFERVDVDHRFGAEELERIFASGGATAVAR